LFDLISTLFLCFNFIVCIFLKQRSLLFIFACFPRFQERHTHISPLQTKLMNLAWKPAILMWVLISNVTMMILLISALNECSQKPFRTQCKSTTQEQVQPTSMVVEETEKRRVCCCYAFNRTTCANVVIVNTSISRMRCLPVTPTLCLEESFLLQIKVRPC